MSGALPWPASAGTIAVLAIYELMLELLSRHNQSCVAMTATRRLREQGFTAASRRPGSEIWAYRRCATR